MKIGIEKINILKDIQKDWVSLQKELNNLESDIREITIKRNDLLSKLDNLREYENSIINNIEEETNKKITQKDLIDILKK